MTSQPGDRWDAVVIGAGPAGSIAAAGLARRGVRTLLVDRAVFPRPKLCGGCLAPAGLGAIQRAGFGSIESVRDSLAVSRLDLHSGKYMASVGIPAYRVVDRSSFDSDLADGAVRSGAVFRDGIRAMVHPDCTVSLEYRRGRNPSVERVRPGIVIVADGLKGGSLAEFDLFAWSVRNASLVGIGGVGERYPGELAPDAISMFHSDEGYLGVARLPSGRADLAAAVRPSWIRRQKGSGPLEGFVRSVGLDPASFGELRSVPGVPSLTRKRRTIEASGRVFVIGDAMGYVEPFTGEGMSWAVESGAQVLPFASDSLEGRYQEGAWAGVVRRERARRTLPCRLVTGALRVPGAVRAITIGGACVPLVDRWLSHFARVAFGATSVEPVK